MEKELLKKGDKVVMHTCLESEKYDGKIWTCATDEVVKGEGCYKQGLVFLENFSGSFDTSFLQKINIEEDGYIQSLENLLIFMCQTYRDQEKILLNLFKGGNEALLKVPRIQGTINTIAIAQIANMEFKQPKLSFRDIEKSLKESSQK